MLSLNQASDLQAALKDTEFRKSLQEFVTHQRLFYMQQAMSALKNLNDGLAKKFAAYDEAYSELLGQLDHFVKKSIEQL